MALSEKRKKEEADKQAEAARTSQRIVGLISQVSENYKKTRLDEDMAALALYRGKHWQGDGISGGTVDTKAYRAQQNEIFPVIDTIVSSLALDVPAVEPLDSRYWSKQVPAREDDLTIAGRRLGAVLNSWAEQDRLDYTFQELVLHACVFGIGVVKTMWSPRLGRPIVRTKLPWEWFCDPGAQRIEDATWAFEYFPLHHSTLRERISSGQYQKISTPIKPDTYPKGLLSDKDMENEEREARAAGLREYVNLVEFWDYKNKRLYHIHPGTGQILLDKPLPWGRTYDVLVFHDAVGRVRGVSDVELMASNQRDINTMLSARREMVFRLPKRMLIDRDLFADEDEFEAFKNSKGWEPVPVRFPNGATPQEKVWTTPEMATTFDFNKHLADLVDGTHNVSGLADYQRGQAENIRTAEEASMVRGASQGRLNIRMRKVVRCAADVFQRMLTTWKWAATNPQLSGLDMEKLSEQTQGDSGGQVLFQDLMEHTPKFKLLPFSPMMEDKYARRQQLVNILTGLSANPSLMGAFNQRELARELQEVFQMRPSVLLGEEEARAAAQAATMAQDPALAPVAQGGVQPDVLAGMQPEMPAIPSM